MEDEIIWKDKKRTFFGLPLSFTEYTLTKEKLIIQTGFLNIKQEEVRLYRIMDVTLNRSLRQRIWGLGTIHCCSADRSTPEFDIMSIKDSEKIKNLLSDNVENERSEKRVTTREYMVSEDEKDLY